LGLGGGSGLSIASAASGVADATTVVGATVAAAACARGVESLGARQPTAARTQDRMIGAVLRLCAADIGPRFESRLVLSVVATKPNAN
jgi:hypothetical protein